MIIDKENLKLPDWNKYAVSQLDYTSNAERHDLACRYKLMQISQDFFIARMNIIFSDERTDYVDLLKCGLDKECMQKIFVQNALLYYNFCIDLSWIMIYLYCLPQKELDFNIPNEEIEKAEKQVNYDVITEYLKFQISITDGEIKCKLERLLHIIDDFWNKVIKNNFRPIYNYTKHQGAYDILYINPKKFFKFENFKTNIDIMESKKFDINKMTNMCIEFNNNFIEYMEKIIRIVIDPSNTKDFYNFNEIGCNIIKNIIKDTKK